MYVRLLFRKFGYVGLCFRNNTFQNMFQTLMCFALVEVSNLKKNNNNMETIITKQHKKEKVNINNDMQ